MNEIVNIPIKEVLNKEYIPIEYIDEELEYIRFQQMKELEVEYQFKTEFNLL